MGTLEGRLYEVRVVYFVSKMFVKWVNSKLVPDIQTKGDSITT